MLIRLYKFLCNKNIILNKNILNNNNNNNNNNIELNFSIPSFKIISVNNNFINYFNWTNEEIQNNEINFIMSKNLYEYIGERKNDYSNKFPGEKLKLARDKISKLLLIRFWPLISKKNKIIWVEVISIESFIDLHFYKNDIFIKVTLKKLDLNGCTPFIQSMYFLQKINNCPELYIDNYDNSLIIMMDIFDSTEIAKIKNPSEIALLYSIIMKEIKKIDYKYFPFFQFIEACGDSLLFLHCEKTMLVKKNISSLGIKFAKELILTINSILKKYNSFIRCSLVKGDIVGGVIDGASVRYFGYPINIAARLESMCNINSIIIDNTYKIELDKEKYNFENNIIEKNSNLKGVGLYSYYEYLLQL